MGKEKPFPENPAVGALWRDTNTGIPGITYVWTGHEWLIVPEEVSTEETVLALQIDVADRDRHIKELEDALERRRIRLACVRDLIDNPRGRSFQAIVECISGLIGEDR